MVYVTFPEWPQRPFQAQRADKWCFTGDALLVEVDAPRSSRRRVLLRHLQWGEVPIELHEPKALPTLEFAPRHTNGLLTVRVADDEAGHGQVERELYAQDVSEFEPLRAFLERAGKQGAGMDVLACYLTFVEAMNREVSAADGTRSLPLQAPPGFLWSETSGAIAFADASFALENGIRRDEEPQILQRFARNFPLECFRKDPRPFLRGAAHPEDYSRAHGIALKRDIEAFLQGKQNLGAELAELSRLDERTLDLDTLQEKLEALQSGAQMPPRISEKKSSWRSSALALLALVTICLLVCAGIFWGAPQEFHTSQGKTVHLNSREVELPSRNGEALVLTHDPEGKLTDTWYAYPDSATPEALFIAHNSPVSIRREISEAFPGAQVSELHLTPSSPGHLALDLLGELTNAEKSLLHQFLGSEAWLGSNPAPSRSAYVDAPHLAQKLQLIFHGRGRFGQAHQQSLLSPTSSAQLLSKLAELRVASVSEAVPDEWKPYRVDPEQEESDVGHDYSFDSAEGEDDPAGDQAAGDAGTAGGEDHAPHSRERESIFTRLRVFLLRQQLFKDATLGRRGTIYEVRGYRGTLNRAHDTLVERGLEPRLLSLTFEAPTLQRWVVESELAFWLRQPGAHDRAGLPDGRLHEDHGWRAAEFDPIAGLYLLSAPPHRIGETRLASSFDLKFEIDGQVVQLEDLQTLREFDSEFRAANQAAKVVRRLLPGCEDPHRFFRVREPRLRSSFDVEFDYAAIARAKRGN